MSATPQHFMQKKCLKILEEIIEPLLYENLLRLFRKIKDVMASIFAGLKAVVWMRISETRIDHHFKKCSITNILNRR